MSAKTKIAWCDHSQNFWIGCSPISPGCDHCYAAAWCRRFGVKWGKGKPRRRTSAANWRLPLRWNAALDKPSDVYHYGPIRPRVFCGSLMDWLDPEVPVEWLADMLDVIRSTSNLNWLLLTKRPQNWKERLDQVLDYEPMPDEDDPQEYFSDWILDWYNDKPPANVWVGATGEDQQRADERIPQLLAIPARVRFLSCEPLLGLVNLRLFSYLSPARQVNDTFIESHSEINWVIVGCESGPGHRPMKIEWAISLRNQCRAAGVPFFMKQIEVAGRVEHDLAKFPPELRVREFPAKGGAP